MAPKKQKVLFTRELGDFVVLTPRDWEAIEKEYGHKIPFGIRVRLDLVTIWFTMFEPAARNAPRKRVIVPKIRRLRNAAHDLNSDLVDRSTGRPDPNMDLILDRFFRTPEQLVHFKPVIQFELLAHLSYQIEELCDEIITTVGEPNYTGHEKNQTWNIWITLISLIMRSAELTSTIRKDVDKQKSSSKFVVLVREIQNRLPREIWRPLYR
jgi:hypothetical protein